MAISRAFLRKNSKLMIMDEPAASLDPIIESNLYNEFGRLSHGRTTIITSHRLGACSLAERILVFDKGRIVEDGSHSQLM